MKPQCMSPIHYIPVGIIIALVAPHDKKCCLHIVFIKDIQYLHCVPGWPIVKCEIRPLRYLRLRIRLRFVLLRLHLPGIICPIHLRWCALIRPQDICLLPDRPSGSIKAPPRLADYVITAENYGKKYGNRQHNILPSVSHLLHIVNFFQMILAAYSIFSIILFFIFNYVSIFYAMNISQIYGEYK